MSMLTLMIDILGFDPTRLAGRPTNFALLYTFGFILSVSIGMGIVLAAPFRLAARIRILCIAGIFVGLGWLTVVQHVLFVEYPGQDTLARDTGAMEPTILPIPLPGLRSRDFDEYWYVGSPRYRNALPAAYEQQTRLPENIAGTFATVALHWFGFVVLLSCLVAAGGLGAKALIQRTRTWLSRPTGDS